MALSISRQTPRILAILGAFMMWKGIQSCVKISLFGLMHLLIFKFCGCSAGNLCDATQINYTHCSTWQVGGLGIKETFAAHHLIG